MQPKSIHLLLTALLLATSLLLPGCTAPISSGGTVQQDPSTTPVTINIMAAASLTAAFTDLGVQFETQHPGVNLQFNFAGSQQLVQQINQGAPVDVFASANAKQMEAAVATGRIAADAPQLFVKNQLVVIYPSENPAQLQTLQNLANDPVKLIFAAKEVPVGQYSLDFLDKAVAEGVLTAAEKEQVLANVVSYEDNVKAVLTKIALGEADAGIVYTSDVTGADAKKVGQIAIPDALNVIAAYPIAALNDAPNPQLAQQFIEFVLSPQGQEILAGHGFIPYP